MIEKYNYEVNINDLVFRRAKKGDNYKELARLIYQTDEYIYPYWFNNNIEECEEFFKNKFDEEGFIFNYDNMYIAYNKKRKKILGLIIALDKSVNLNYDYSKIESINERYKITINQYIKEIIKKAKMTNSLYIMNFTVLDGYRGKRIGTKLLGYFLSQMELAGHNSYSLDCPLHDLRAKNLCHSLGFKEVMVTIRFDGTNHSNVEAVTFLRHKGNYLPEEFQQKQNYNDLY